MRRLYVSFWHWFHRDITKVHSIHGRPCPRCVGEWIGRAWRR